MYRYKVSANQKRKGVNTVKQIETIEVAALKKQIDQELESENYEAVELLTQRLCEMQGFETETQMPKSFVFTIKLKEKAEKLMSIKRNTVKAATLLLVLGVSGGSVYAAVQHFKSAEHMEYGLMAGDTDAVTESESEVANKALLESKNKVEIVSTEQGDDSVAWLTKEVRKETHIGYLSDDNVTWKEDVPDVADVTEYSYQDYSAACTDTDMQELFETSFEQDGKAVYTEYHHQSEDAADAATLVSDFKYNNGSFTVNESKALDWDGTDIASAVITSTEPVTNQREYVAANGEVFKLSDDTETGVLRTTVLVSYDAYTAIITFTDLSDQEIHEILDAIHIGH